jgi:hypothetical protein
MGHSTKVFADPSHGWVVNSVAHPLCVGERQRRFLDRNPPVEPIWLEQTDILAKSLGYCGVRFRISPSTVSCHNWNVQMIKLPEHGWIAVTPGQRIAHPGPVRSPNPFGVSALMCWECVKLEEKNELKSFPLDNVVAIKERIKLRTANF